MPNRLSMLALRFGVVAATHAAVITTVIPSAAWCTKIDTAVYYHSSHELQHTSVYLRLSLFILRPKCPDG